MPDDLTHNPRPMPKHDDCRAAALARTLRREAARNRTPAGAAFLTDCAATIEHLLSENAMARDFVSAAPIVVAAATQAQADKAALQTQLDTANATIVTLQANQLTPEVQAAQQTVIDAAEKLQPSPPAAA
jgi:replicative DNA helicase